jgi:hypothetical protein
MPLFQGKKTFIVENGCTQLLYNLIFLHWTIYYGNKRTIVYVLFAADNDLIKLMYHLQIVVH